MKNDVRRCACGQPITPQATQCKSCASKAAWKRGAYGTFSGHSEPFEPPPSKSTQCTDCGGFISRPKTLCAACEWARHMAKVRKGKAEAAS